MITQAQLIIKKCYVAILSFSDGLNVIGVILMRFRTPIVTLSFGAAQN
jgi:hypothetical protein